MDYCYDSDCDCCEYFSVKQSSKISRKVLKRQYISLAEDYDYLRKITISLKKRNTKLELMLEDRIYRNSRRKESFKKEINSLKQQIEELSINSVSSVREAPKDFEDTEGTENNRCCCCLDKRPVYLFSGCGHLCICSGCSTSFKTDNTCPLCYKKSQITFVYY